MESELAQLTDEMSQFVIVYSLVKFRFCSRGYEHSRLNLQKETTA